MPNNNFTIGPGDTRGSVVNINDFRPLSKDASPPLHGGGGGGTFDDMDAIWKKLADHENRFDRIDAKLDNLLKGQTDIRVEVAEVKGRLAAMPTTIQLLGFVVAIFVAAGILKYFGH